MSLPAGSLADPVGLFSRPLDSSFYQSPMLRLGLCCTFAAQPIKFRTTTAAVCARLSHTERRKKLAGICGDNLAALGQSIDYCLESGIGAFRINSAMLPIATHPEFGYQLSDLPDGESLIDECRRLGTQAEKNGLRLSFHPDQYVLLSSPREEVTARSLADLELHGRLAEWLGADVINIHAGGAYGDKPAALDQVRRNLDRLSDQVRSRLTLENDDRTYTPDDLLPLCRHTEIPLVYDVHHHRCLPDGLTAERAHHLAAETWNREQMVHLSSPKEGWNGPKPSRHHGRIDPEDFPEIWLTDEPLTIDVEAKDKELAVAELDAWLSQRKTIYRPGPNR